MSDEQTATEKTFQIYSPGYPDEGMPLTETQLQDALGSGQLKSCDLVWCDGAWRQLSDVFELPEFRLPDCSDAGEADIALKLSDLPPCGIAPALQPDSVLLPRWRKILLRVLYSNGRRRPLWVLALAAALLIAGLAVGYLYFLVPGFNQLFWRPAYVLLVNPYAKKCSIDFMGQKFEVPGDGTLTIPDIFGRMPRTETMYLTAPGDKTPKKLNVHLRAGQTVLVNPMGMSSFGVMDKDAAGAVIDGSAKTRALRDIIAFRAPEAALALGMAGRQIGQRALIDSTDSPCVYSADPIVTKSGLDFAQLGLIRSGAHLEHDGPDSPAAGKNISRNLLKGIVLGDTKVFYRKGSREVAECSVSVELPAGLKAPVTRHCKKIPEELREVEPLGGKARCRIRFSAKQTVVRLELERRNFMVRRNQRVLRGAWTYEAVRDAKSGAWSWHWRFDGQDDVKVGHLALDLNEEGKLTVGYQETRGRK